MIPVQGYIAHVCSGGKFKNNVLQYSALKLRKDRNEESFSFSTLIHDNKKERSVDWLVRRLFQLQTLNYNKNDFLLVIPVAKLKEKLPHAEMKYDLVLDTFNHTLLCANSGILSETDDLATAIIDLVNENPEEYIYPIKKYKCSHDENCPYSQ